MRSKTLFEEARRHIPGGVNSPVRAFEPNPFFVKEAKGARIYDVDGKEYIDYVMGYGPLLFGHANERIINRVKEAVERGTLYGAPTEEEVELARRIKKFYPSIEMVRLVNSGTEATMHAIRLARGFTGRRKIIKFEGCFHGSHDSVLVKAGSGALTFGIPSSSGVLEDTARHTLVSRYNDISLTEDIARKNRDDLAAIIVEPVMANSGLIPPDMEFLRGLRSIADELGCVLIFDEVVTGFRLSPGGAQEYYGVKADLTTLGKVLGGGFPIAAFGGREEIMRNISPSGRIYQAGTFSGNPVSVAAALAVTEMINEGIYSYLRDYGKKLVSAIRDIIDDRNLKATVNHVESMFQIFFTDRVRTYEEALSSDLKKFRTYFMKMLEKGIFIPPSQFETCFISTAHSDEEMKITIEALDEALKIV
ncbi:MAG: glutamate-1-semialdehyde 2,1-aminomutase [Candidatus Methanodesulfokora washburnensis]|jgi:glutamate-1-semialdehyde 2,1-aminomutase